jgi:hypothetical protein
MMDDRVGNSKEFAPEIQELLDKQQIRDLMSRYARAVDRNEWGAVKSCFTDDATDHHGVVVGSIDDLVEVASARLDKTWAGMHCLCQHYIEIDGDNARGETYALTSRRRFSASGDGEEDTFSGLRYLDRYRRVSGEWKIAERVTALEWCTTIPARNWLPVEKFITGKKDKSDISYTFGFR